MKSGDLFGRGPENEAAGPADSEESGRSKPSESMGKKGVGPGCPGGPGILDITMGNHETETGALRGSVSDSAPRVLISKSPGPPGPPGHPESPPIDILVLKNTINNSKGESWPGTGPGGPESGPGGPVTGDVFGFDWPEGVEVAHREALDTGLLDLLPARRTGLRDVWIDFDVAGHSLRLITDRGQIAAARADGKSAVTPLEALTIGLKLHEMPLSAARRLGAGLAKAKAGGKAWARRKASSVDSGVALWWPGAEGFCGAQLMTAGPTVARLLWQMGGNLVDCGVVEPMVMPGIGGI